MTPCSWCQARRRVLPIFSVQTSRDTIPVRMRPTPLRFASPVLSLLGTVLLIFVCGCEKRSLASHVETTVRLASSGYGDQLAREYGRLFTLLLSIGRPMQVVDVMVAAIALSLGNCTVVTTDSDLSAVPGLTVENWATT